METESKQMEDSLLKSVAVSTTRRQALTHTDFRNEYQYIKPVEKSAIESTADVIRSQCNCTNTLSSRYWCNFAKHHIPIISWIPRYSARQNLVSDIIAGITVGVMHIPQGMAYAMLANVPPVLGLYVSLFPVIIYAFMGTSRHISIGTFAVVCLMLSKSVDRLASPTSQPPIDSGLNNITMSDINTSVSYTPVEVAVVVCFTVGVIQILMGLLRLGSLSVFLSDTLITGFTTGAAVHVLTSQVKNLFGIAIPSHNGPLKLIYVYVDIFSVIQNSNYTAVLISVITIAVLLFVSEIINPLLKPKIKIPLPMELLAIAIGTYLSYMLELKPKYNINVVGYIPTGLPAAKRPPFELIPKVITSSIPIAIVGFTIALSMAKLFSKKHKYDIDPNQELLSLGTANVFSSFFSCFPCCASLSRSLIQEASGGKTQVAGFVSCAFLLTILLVVSPLFETLPNCVLSSIIVVALVGMFRQFREVKSLWKISKMECMIWIITFAGVVLTDVDVGLAIGLIVSLFSVIVRTQRPYACLLGQIAGTDLYMDISKYKTAKEDDCIKVVRFSSSLYYANREYFRSELYRLVGVNPPIIISKHNNLNLAHQLRQNHRRERKPTRSESEESMATGNIDYEGSVAGILTSSDESHCSKEDTPRSVLASTSLKYSKNEEHTILLSVQHIIIDCSMWSFIDIAGITTLVQIIKEYDELGMSVFLASCSDTIMETMEKHPAFTDHLEKCISPTIHDAKSIIYHRITFRDMS